MNAFTQPRPTLRAAALTGFAALLTFGSVGCKGKTEAQVPNTNGDPASANLAQPYTGASSAGQAQVLGQSQSYTSQASGESYETQTPAPIIRQTPAGSATHTVQYYPVPQAQGAQNGQAAGNGYPQGYDNQASYDPTLQGYDDAEQAGEQALAEADQPPPPLPEYDQPPAPEDDYMWTPGYWDYAQTGYYWVPGAWVAPPFYGALWTPPYWAYERNHYICHRGYWGPHVGYYGGVNYGFGYIGFGYFGGYWSGHDFFYNRAVTNVNVERIHNVYIRTVVYDGRQYGPRPYDRVSYNGGRGGLSIQPRPQEIAAMHEAHYAPLPDQRQHRLDAATNRSQFFATNGGRPAQPFVGHPIGAVNNIPIAPREQAFNARRLGGQPNQPAYNNNRPGEFNRPGNQPNQPGTQPAYNNNRTGDFNRPGMQPNQPAYNNNRPGEFNRPGNQPNQPGTQPAYNNNRTGDFNRPGNQPNQPTYNNNRPGDLNRPGGAQPAYNNDRHAAQPDQPGFNGYQPGNLHRPAVTPNTTAPNQPAPTQPAPNMNRPNGFSRETQPAQPRPGFDQQRPAQPQTQAQPQPRFDQRTPQPQAQPQPRFEQRTPQSQPRQDFQQRGFQPQPQSRPNFEQRTPQPQQQPQPQPRQNFEQPRSVQAQPQARPQMSAPRPAAPTPAPAPHTNGGHEGEHGHNH